MAPQKVHQNLLRFLRFLFPSNLLHFPQNSKNAVLLLKCRQQIGLKAYIYSGFLPQKLHYTYSIVIERLTWKNCLGRERLQKTAQEKSASAKKKNCKQTDLKQPGLGLLKEHNQQRGSWRDKQQLISSTEVKHQRHDCATKRFCWRPVFIQSRRPSDQPKLPSGQKLVQAEINVFWN